MNQPSVRSAFGTVTIAVVVFAAAIAALGTPDFGLAGQFLGGSYPSTDAALAVVSIIFWVLILGFLVGVSIGAFKAATESQLLFRRWTRALTFLVVGSMVLAIGVYRHASVGYAMSCNDCQQRITEATQLAGQ
jgi:hypothetical protein